MRPGVAESLKDSIPTMEEPIEMPSIDQQNRPKLSNQQPTEHRQKQPKCPQRLCWVQRDLRGQQLRCIHWHLRIVVLRCLSYQRQGKESFRVKLWHLMIAWQKQHLIADDRIWRKNRYHQ